MDNRIATLIAVFLALGLLPQTLGYVSCLVSYEPDRNGMHEHRHAFCVGGR